MGRTGRHLVACALACSLAAPSGASVLEPAQGAVLAPADELAGLELSAQPLTGSLPAAGFAAQIVGQAAGQLGMNEIASRLDSDRSAGAAVNAAGPVLFWVFGSGVLGAAFVARRRKPLRRKA